MINAAVVGLGWWGKQIVESLHGKSDKITVVRGVDVNIEPVTDFLSEKGLPYYTDYQQALDDESIDAVILTLPHSVHESAVLQAVAAGKQVFCEKPLSLTAASAKRMVEACNDAGLVLGLGHERRYEPAMEELARMVKAGELGTVLSVEGNFSHDKFVTLDGSNWRGNPKDAPAAGWTGMGIHLTDLLISLLGPITEIRAVSARRVLDLPSGDVVSTQFVFADGTIGAINVVSATPFYGRLAVFGSDAWIDIFETRHPENPGSTLVTVGRKNGDREETRLEPVDTVKMNLEAWADAVAGTGTYRFTDEERIANVAVLEALAKSTETGEPEKVDN